jgi:uncharacterized protein (TIGR00369 family)
MDESIDRERMQLSFERCRFHQHLKLELEIIEKGKVRVWVRYAPELDQAMGLLHGGVFAAALDTATYYAALSHYGFSDKLPLTQEYKLNLLATAKQEDVYVDATLLRAGRHVAVVEAKIYTASGTLVAAGMASFLIRS